MATQTTHFDMVKQQSAEHVSVGLLNDNFDIIDQVMYDNQEKSEQLADEYNAGTTYNVGDYVRRENYIYKCNTASTTGVWDSTKWDRVKVMESVETAEDGVDNAFKTMGVMGAKNLNSLPYVDSTKTNNGVTFTLRPDGTITTSGTASANSNATFLIHHRAESGASTLRVKNGRYILSGCPTGGGPSKYYLSSGRTYNGAFSSVGSDYGEGKEITLNGDDFSNDEVTLQLSINIYRGANADGLVFKPMLRLATDQDDTWQPYAMTNKELTDVVNNVPDTAGTYTLQAVRNADNTITYSWV